jgi:superfamily II DNA or RNA helicase
MINNTRCLFFDEVHGAGAPNAYAVQKLFNNAYYKFGQSATPIRTEGDDLLLEAAFGKRIVDISYTELIEKGFLARPTFYIVKFKHDRVAAEFNYAQLYNQEVTNNADRNIMLVKIVSKFWAANKKILISVNLIEHGNILKEMLGKVIGKDNVIFVRGASSTAIRSKVLKGLDTGEYRCVIATRIFNEGVDIPGLNVLVNLKAQLSAIDYIQTIGRALRKTETKDHVTIVDVYDFGCRWLTGHSRERLDILQEENFKINMIDEAKI